ncbi:MAG: radical SAM protein [Clostridia bacterium]|nr:radical SAM protein [Clostridia bacterium]
MQIGKVVFPVTTLGPGTRIGIWTQGCYRACKGCSNPELQLFDKSKEISVTELVSRIKDFSFDGVTISGGEPFVQVEELYLLIKELRMLGVDDILIYSGFTKEELESRQDEKIYYILSEISVLIDGPFIAELVDDVPLRGSSNQRVWLFKDKYKDAYRQFLGSEKRVDIFEHQGWVHFIGIPGKDYQDVYKKYLEVKPKNE